MTDSWFSLSGIWVAMILESANLNLVRSPCTEASCFESGMCNLPLLPRVCLNGGSEIWNLEFVEPLRESTSWNLLQIFPESEIWNVLCLLNGHERAMEKLKSWICANSYKIPPDSFPQRLIQRDSVGRFPIQLDSFVWFRFNEIPFIKVSNPVDVDF